MNMLKKIIKKILIEGFFHIILKAQNIHESDQSA